LVEQATKGNIIDAREATLLRDTHAVVRDAIDVDEFGEMRGE
jgi:hypothetical protein